MIIFVSVSISEASLINLVNWTIRLTLHFELFLCNLVPLGTRRAYTPMQTATPAYYFASCCSVG